MFAFLRASPIGRASVVALFAMLFCSTEAEGRASRQKRSMMGQPMMKEEPISCSVKLSPSLLSLIKGLQQGMESIKDEMESLQDFRSQVSEQINGASLISNGIQNGNSNIPMTPKEQRVKEKPKDCSEVFSLGHRSSGVHLIFPPKSNSSLRVFCDFESGSPWTVIQRRSGEALNFDRKWDDYVNGFGKVEGDHWLGLVNIHHLVSQRPSRLRIELADWRSNIGFADFSSVDVGDESSAFLLRVGNYTGSIGNALAGANGKRFSTKDRDNDDRWKINCAEAMTGGWWFSDCGRSNLNGAYKPIGPDAGKLVDAARGERVPTGLHWGNWVPYDSNPFYSFKATEIKVAPF